MMELNKKSPDLNPSWSLAQMIYRRTYLTLKRWEKAGIIFEKTKHETKKDERLLNSKSIRR